MNLIDFIAKYYRQAGLPEPQTKNAQLDRRSKHFNGRYRATKAYADGRQKQDPRPRRKQK